MKVAPAKSTDDLRMSGKDFDEVMRRALQVHPKEAPKLKRPAKAQRKHK